MIFICSSVAAVAIDTNGDECSRGLTDQLCNPRSGVFVAESQDGIAFSSARVDEVQYGGQHAFNVLQFNESAGVDKAPYFVQRQSDGNKLVTRDPFDPDPSRRYKIVGSERALSDLCPRFACSLTPHCFSQTFSSTTTSSRRATRASRASTPPALRPSQT